MSPGSGPYLRRDLNNGPLFCSSLILDLQGVRVRAPYQGTVLG